MTLRRKLLVSLLLTLLPLAALGLTTFLLVRDSLLDDAMTEVVERATVRADDFATRLDIAHGELETVALWPQLAQPVNSGAASADPSVLDEPLAVVSSFWAQFREIAVVGRDGNVLRSTDEEFSDRIQLESTTGPATGLPLLVGDRWLLALSHPIPPRDDVFVIAEISSEFLVQGGMVPVGEAKADGTAAGAHVLPGDAANLVSFLADHESTDAAIEAVTSAARGDNDLVGVSEVSGSGFSVAVGVDRGDVLRPLNRLRWAILVALAAALVVVLILAATLGRTISRRIAHLRDVTTAIGDGDLSRRAGDLGSDELGELSVSFDRMAEQLATDNQLRRKIQDELSHQALHDPLTGLANRVKFLDRLEDALARSTRSGSPVAVLFCDLDNLKIVNDRLGHAAGDDLLSGVAERFRHSVRPSDTVARFGGDEFVVLCAEMASPDDARVVAERLCSALTEPFSLAGEAVVSTASIGIAVGTGASSRALELVEDADSAMYEAKDLGRAQYVLHSDTLADRSRRRQDLSEEASKALRLNELRIEFQPVVELETGRVVHVETFVRWDHPDRGLVGPPELLAQFADAKLLIELDRWVLDASLRQAALWNATRGDATRAPITVNLSTVTIQSDVIHDLLDELLTTHQVPPGQLAIEVSEPGLVDDPAATATSLDLVGELGVGLILDDFGTGHSSIERLRRYGFSAMKIDGAVVRGLTAGDEGPVVAALSLARALNMDAIAEGVEQIEQVQQLLLHGCRFAQGHLFCAPIDPVGLESWLARLEL